MKGKTARWRVRRNVAEDPLPTRRLRGVGWARCDINRMWERECLSSDTLYPCCPSASFDIANHPLHCCTSITAPSSHRLPIWLEGIATWFPIWNTPLHSALRYVNALLSLSSSDSFHAEKNRPQQRIFLSTFSVAWLLISYLLLIPCTVVPKHFYFIGYHLNLLC